MSTRCNHRNSWRDPQLIDKHGSAVADVNVWAQSDVEHRNSTAHFSVEKVCALHRPKREGEIRGQCSAFTRRGIETTRNIQRDNGGATCAHRARSGERIGNQSARLTRRTGAKQTVDDQLLPAVEAFRNL